MADSRPTEPNAKVIVPRDGPREEAIDELRHNGTHTIPPGVRAGWLAKPLPRLTEEHLQATDELESTRLALRTQGSQRGIAFLPLGRRTALRLLLGLAIAAAIGLFVAFRSTRPWVERSARAKPELATAKTLAATPKAQAATPSPVIPASVTPAMDAPGTEPLPKEPSAVAPAVEASATKATQNRAEAAPRPSAVGSPRAAVPPPRGREPGKKSEARRLDDNDEPLFGPR